MILFLSDVAGSEVLLILVFVLMFFGSKSIPGLAKTMGRTMRQIKDASQDLQNEIKKSGMDMKKDLDLNRMLQETAEDIERPFENQARELERPFQQQATELNSSISFTPPKVFEMPVNPIPSKFPTTKKLIEPSLETETIDQVNSEVEEKIDTEKLVKSEDRSEK